MRSSAHLLLLAVTGGCLAAAPEVDGPPEALAGGWVVVAADGGIAVLAPPPDRASGRSGGVPTDSVELLVHQPGEELERRAVGLEPLRLPGVAPEQARALRVGWVAAGERAIAVNLPGESPQLLRSPADPARALFEEGGALWLLERGAAPRRATAERVGAFAREELAVRQREGEVILYWAAAPVWRPDGAAIAYASNREAVARGGGGQSIWLLELASGAERALLHEAGRSYRPIGWLGGDLLFIGDVPGVEAMNPESGERRGVASGVQVAVAPDGSALAVADAIPGGAVVRLIGVESEVELPAPEPPFSYSPQARFSPTGNRLLLEATAEAGRRRQYLVYDRSPASLRRVTLPPGELRDWPAWLDDRTLVVVLADSTGAEERTHLLPLD